MFRQIARLGDLAAADDNSYHTVRSFRKTPVVAPVWQICLRDGIPFFIENFTPDAGRPAVCFQPPHRTQVLGAGLGSPRQKVSFPEISSRFTHRITASNLRKWLIYGFCTVSTSFPHGYIDTKTLQKESKLSITAVALGGVVLGGYFVCPDTAVRPNRQKNTTFGSVFGAGDEARTHFPASHEWLLPFAGTLPHLFLI